MSAFALRSAINFDNFIEVPAMRYPRNLQGYGPNPPDDQWPGRARPAVHVRLNYGEGGGTTLLKVAAASAGSHDNRMDKIWWNEQWMGWPIGPEYAASSNVDNAQRLRGKMLLIVGEVDRNVDQPATLHVGTSLLQA